MSLYIQYKRYSKGFLRNFISSILWMPKFQKIINSFLSSYLAITKVKLKKRAKGNILLTILGKFNMVYLIYIELLRPSSTIMSKKLTA